MFSPLEAIDEEIQNTPDMQEQLKECIADGGLPPSYFRHPLKVAAPEGMPVYPCFLYIDGVKFQRTDSVLRFTVKCLVTLVNHLCVVVRKSEMCACGCHGWCTIFVVMLALDWAFVWMAKGRRPETNYDGTAWLDSDSRKKRQA